MHHCAHFLSSLPIECPQACDRLHYGDCSLHPVLANTAVIADRHGGHVTGYIRVAVFSQNAAADVQHAVQELQTQVNIFDIQC